MEDYLDWVNQIVKSFGALMAEERLAFSDRLESTLDIIYYINAHFYQKLSVKDVLIHANQYCNPARVQWPFGDEMQMPISEFISVQKMRAARRLLKETNDLIQEIATRLKFYDLNDFSKQFKRKMHHCSIASFTRSLIREKGVVDENTG